MAPPPRPDRLLTVEEYLAIDNESPTRHEYVAGVMYAKSGSTIRHDLVAGNVLALLRAATSGGQCRVFMGGVKVRVADDEVYYPDLAVVCGPIDQRAYVAESPCLVVEVTSPSTRRIDRGEKLDACRAVPSLRAYLIVEQGARVVERHWRDAAGEWRHAVVTAGSIPIPCPETSLSLDEIYRDIELDAVDEPAPRPRRIREGAPS